MKTIDLLLDLGAFVADYRDGLHTTRSFRQTYEKAERLIAAVNEAVEQIGPVFLVTNQDVLEALDALGDDYPIARALEHGDVEDACACVRSRFLGTVAEELDDILQIFLEDLEEQKHRDNRRLW